MTTVWSRGSGAPDTDLWDDTELIRAYDEAIKSYKKAHESEGGEDRTSEKRAKSSPPPPLSAAGKSDAPALKRAKPAAKKAAASQAADGSQPVRSEVNVASQDSPAQQGYWQSGYAAQGSWYENQAVAPSYFAPSIPAPLAPVQDEALTQLLQAWYNAGYQAGRYQALRGAPS